jgi:hypothetical protein
MLIPFRTACFVSLAAAAGMFSQQVASKFSSASEEAQVVTLADMDHCSTAEDFYRAGRFRPSVDVVLAQSPAEETGVAEAPTEKIPSGEGYGETTSRGTEQTAILNVADATPEIPKDEATASRMDETCQVENPEVLVVATLPRANDSVPAESVASEPEVAEPQPAEAETASVPAEAVPVARDARGFGEFPEEPQTVPTIPPERTRASAGVPLVRQSEPPFYGPSVPESSRRYADPAELVRQRAALRGEELRRRVETRRWLGISPLRPNVDAFPYSSLPSQTRVVVVPLLTRDEHGTHGPSAAAR